MPKYEEGGISPSSVSPKWVKSKRRKRNRDRRAKVGNNIGQLHIVNAKKGIFLYLLRIIFTALEKLQNHPSLICICMSQLKTFKYDKVGIRYKSIFTVNSPKLDTFNCWYPCVDIELVG